MRKGMRATNPVNLSNEHFEQMSKRVECRSNAKRNFMLKIFDNSLHTFIVITTPLLATAGWKDLRILAIVLEERVCYEEKHPILRAHQAYGDEELEPRRLLLHREQKPPSEERPLVQINRQGFRLNGELDF